MKERYYIGLDVHKDTVAIASMKSTSRAEATYHSTCGGSNVAVERALRNLAKQLSVKTPRFQNRITNGHPEPSTLDQCHHVRSYTGRQPITSMFATAQSKLSLGVKQTKGQTRAQFVRNSSVLTLAVVVKIPETNTFFSQSIEVRSIDLTAV
jgi:hypothetical protein